MSPEEYSKSFLFCPKMTTATSTEHNTDNSCAFLNKPPLRLRKVLEEAVSFVSLTRPVHLHRAVPFILDRLDLNLASSHDFAVVMRPVSGR